MGRHKTAGLVITRGGSKGETVGYKYLHRSLDPGCAFGDNIYITLISAENMKYHPPGFFFCSILDWRWEMWRRVCIECFF